MNIYSTQTGKTFCREAGMEFYDIIHRNNWALKDDVMCYTIVNNEMKFYYFKR